VTAKGVEIGGIAAEWPQRRASVQRIRIREPWALVERDKDGTLPLLALIALKPAGSAAPATPGGATPRGIPAPATADGEKNGPRLDVGTLAVEEGFVRFTDRTTTPRFVEEASHLAVTARGLGTLSTTRSEISAGARLTGGAQVDLQGTTGPIGGPLFADLQGKLSGLALNRANPYLNQLIGWVARQGSIGCTTHFRIRGDHIEAENEIVIGQPQFAPSRRGDEVRERVGVPLDLLVSLLENSHREVRMSVPVTGTLSSRQFDFGDAVWDAIRKAAINVLALPVSWVGKMFYTEDARIATISIWPVYFEPGTTTMRRGFDKHAERLATFMRQTPSIAFAIKPVMTVEDVDAIKREALRKRHAGPRCRNARLRRGPLVCGALPEPPGAHRGGRNDGGAGQGGAFVGQRASGACQGAPRSGPAGAGKQGGREPDPDPCQRRRRAGGGVGSGPYRVRDDPRRGAHAVTTTEEVRS
jgi:hypothetical protein